MSQSLIARPSTVIFDWGNTLCDFPLRTEPEQIAFLHDFLTDPASFRGLASVAVPTSVPPAILQTINRERADCRVVRFADRLRHLLPGHIDDADAAVLERRLCGRIFAGSRIMPEAEQVIAALRPMGYRTAILSNTPWGTSPLLWRAQVEHHASLSRGCDLVMFCGDCGYRKPSLIAFEACLTVLREPAERVMMVGDNYRSDVLGARGAGCQAIWLRHDAALPGETIEGAVVTRLGDVLALLDKAA